MEHFLTLHLSMCWSRCERSQTTAMPDIDEIGLDDFAFGLLAQKRGPQLTAFFSSDRFEFGQGLRPRLERPVDRVTCVDMKRRGSGQRIHGVLPALGENDCPLLF